MSDIVNRLRWAATLGDLTTTRARNLMEEAAARIAELQATLRGVLTYYNAPTPAEAKLKKAVLATPIEQARAALGEKE
jgi:hypothetical protein